MPGATSPLFQGSRASPVAVEYPAAFHGRDHAARGQPAVACPPALQMTGIAAGIAGSAGVLPIGKAIGASRRAGIDGVDRPSRRRRRQACSRSPVRPRLLRCGRLPPPLLAATLGGGRCPGEQRWLLDPYPACCTAAPAPNRPGALAGVAIPSVMELQVLDYAVAPPRWKRHPAGSSWRPSMTCKAADRRVRPAARRRSCRSCSRLPPSAAVPQGVENYRHSRRAVLSKAAFPSRCARPRARR